ncbi:MAG TPA: putative lipid II flippase FtsW [Firmicutes bacterium]|jgi:cell division protein FtsW|nr:putative lipid II flippase FtsW [Bacillota bacterium]HOQ24600.1 putative lipid II flippase FtsW [Bacillota bacterium]HPT67816.1 putative lipid II flippase FtsW [Bacillota bacterium]
MAKMRRHPPDLLILCAVLILLVIGVIAVGSAGTPESLKITGGADPLYYGRKQLFYAITGVLLMFVAMRVDYHRLRRLTIPLSIITIASLAAVLLVGRDISGAKRWIHLGFIQFQPSELAKLSLIFFLADYLAKLGRDVRNFTAGLLVPLIFTGIIAGLIMLEPDLGTTIALLAIFGAMIFAAGVRMAHIVPLFLCVVLAVVPLVISEPYRLRRLTSFLDPYADPSGAGWQSIQSLMALGSGGLFGMGLGRSRLKYFYLPEAHTDYIFAIIGEELGLLGTLTILGLFLFLTWRGYRAALHAPDKYGCFLAVGITSYLVLQAVINIAVVTVTIPATGITLPLISSGGTSLWITLVSMGVLLNISRSQETAEGVVPA